MSDFNIRALETCQKVLLGQRFDRSALFSAARYIERDLRLHDPLATCVPSLVDNPGPDDVFRLGLDRAPESLKEFAGQRDALLVEFGLTVTDGKMSLKYQTSKDMTPRA
ncbi:hypothetical protein [Litorimonas haliclonae]|uniref:hypothetical protein n=1 Tax=Litorimonas haliclonae TaxID=2081977 RepID=UPI0039F0D8D1